MHQEIVSYLFNKSLQELLNAVLFENGPWINENIAQSKYNFNTFTYVCKEELEEKQNYCINMKIQVV